MVQETKKTGNEVLASPGEKLGVIEEFISGKGTYVEDGGIYSSITGKLVLDVAKREIQIQPRTRQPLIPREGDIVFGKVTNVQARTLTTSILQINDSQIPIPFTGIMHISDVSRGYIETMNDAFKAGDLIRTKVISTKNREVHLSTQNENLGVIQALCTRCGGHLVLRRTRLRCNVCNKIEKRKIIANYGKAS